MVMSGKQSILNCYTISDTCFYFCIYRRVLDVKSTHAIMAGHAWTRVTETCFTVSVMRCTAASNVKDPKACGTLTPHECRICDVMNMLTFDSNTYH